jgi:hypothetical protein
MFHCFLMLLISISAWYLPLAQSSDLEAKLGRHIIGQEAAIHRLNQALSQPSYSRPKILVLCGGPGSGRTTLARALAYVTFQQEARQFNLLNGTKQNWPLELQIHTRLNPNGGVIIFDHFQDADKSFWQTLGNFWNTGNMTATNGEQLYLGHQLWIFIDTTGRVPNGPNNLKDLQTALPDNPLIQQLAQNVVTLAPLSDTDQLQLIRSYLQATLNALPFQTHFDDQFTQQLRQYFYRESLGTRSLEAVSRAITLEVWATVAKFNYQRISLTLTFEFPGQGEASPPQISLKLNPDNGGRPEIVDLSEYLPGACQQQLTAV